MTDAAANLRHYLEQRRRQPAHLAACSAACGFDCKVARRRAGLNDLERLCVAIGDVLAASQAEMNVPVLIEALAEHDLATDDAANVRLTFLAWMHAKARDLDRRMLELDFAEAAQRAGQAGVAA